jgi:hypothetical protein
MSRNSKKLPESSADHMVSSHQTGRGYLTGPGLFEFPVDYAVVDGLAIHEGCIELGTVEEVEAEAQRIRAEHLLRKTTEAAAESDMPDDPHAKGIGLPTTSSFLWTDGVVPYTIAGNVPTPARVDDAIRHIEEMSAIRFVRRTPVNANRYPNYVEIISNGNEGWSSSAIGMRGGRQVIRFSDRHSWPVLVHEFLHALGVYHEQSRSDRDDFVEIRWDNIQEDALGNFQKKPDAVDYFDYDYGSIMHYPRTSFAKDSSKPTIVPRQSGVTIGQRQGMSHGDRQTLARIYERFFPRGYAGVWRAGTGGYGLWVGAEWASFQQKWQEWSAQGLRLQDIHVQQQGGRTLYSGVFRQGAGSHGLWANVDWASFAQKWREWSAQGLRLVNLHVHRAGGQNRYSGVFLPGNGGHGLWANVDWASFEQKWREWSAQGLRLVKLHVHRVDGQNRYSGIFLAGNGGHGLWANTTWASFVAKWQEWSAQGLRLVDLNLHQSDGETRYSGVFLPGAGAHYLWANVTFEGLRAKWQELAEQGLRLIDFEISNAEGVAADASEAAPMALEEDGVGGAAVGDAIDVALELQPGAQGAGGAFFPDQDAASGTEQQGGLGGAFFDEEPAASPEEAEASGGAFFPDQPAANGDGQHSHGGASLVVASVANGASANSAAAIDHAEG